MGRIKLNFPLLEKHVKARLANREHYVACPSFLANQFMGDKYDWVDAFCFLSHRCRYLKVESIYCDFGEMEDKRLFKITLKSKDN